MNRKIIIIKLLFLFLIINFSCNQRSEKKPSPCEGFLETLKAIVPIETIFKENKKDYVVVVPSTGCSSCIDKTIHFYNSNSKSNLFFVFTRIIDYKLLKNKLSKNNNLYIDVHNSLSSVGCLNIYPIIIAVKTEKMEAITPSVSVEDCIRKLK